MRDIMIADLEAAYDMLAKPAVDLVNGGLEVDPQMFALQISDDEPGMFAHAAMLDSSQINKLQSTPRTKEMMMDVIRALLMHEPSFVQIISHLTEVWTAKYRTDADLHMPAKDRPDKTEALMIVVHTRKRSFTQVMPIIKDPVSGKRHVDYKGLFGGDTEYIGRFNMHGDDIEP